MKETRKYQGPDTEVEVTCEGPSQKDINACFDWSIAPLFSTWDWLGEEPARKVWSIIGRQPLRTAAGTDDEPNLDPRCRPPLDEAGFKAWVIANPPGTFPTLVEVVVVRAGVRSVWSAP